MTVKCYLELKELPFLQLSQLEVLGFFFLLPLGPSNKMNEGNIIYVNLSVISIGVFNIVTLM